MGDDPRREDCVARRTLTDRRRELNKREQALDAREKALVRRTSKPVGEYRGYAAQALGSDGDADDPLQVARWLAWRAIAVAHEIGKGEASSGRHMAWPPG